MFTCEFNRRQFKQHKEVIRRMPSPYLPLNVERDATLKLDYTVYGPEWDRVHNMLDNLTSIYADPTIVGTIDRAAIDKVQSRLIGLLAKLDSFKQMNRG